MVYTDFVLKSDDIVLHYRVLKRVGIEQPDVIQAQKLLAARLILVYFMICCLKLSVLRMLLTSHILYYCSLGIPILSTCSSVYYVDNIICYYGNCKWLY